MFRCTAVLVLLAVASANSVTPIEKVISLIDGLRREVEQEARDEAKAYNQFACFCKSTTGKKVSSVKKESDNINRLSASIADKTQEQKEDSSELAKRKQKHEQLNMDLTESITRCKKQKAEYDAEAADMSKAIQGLKDAIKSMKDSKPSLLEIKTTLGKTFEMAEAMSLLHTQKHKAVAAFLQDAAKVDPSDPEYKFHSNEIIDMCEDLLKDYKANKKDLDEEWSKTDKACKGTQAGLRKSLSSNSAAMKQLEKDIQRLKKEVAQHREDLVTSEGVLKDDEQYLKDLTARCEARANDYDQRSAMRAGEVDALKTALKVLRGTVKGRADKVNERALLQEASVASAPVTKPSVPAPVQAKAAEPKMKSISFLQAYSANTLSEESRKQKALDVLRTEGGRMGSLALTALAERAAADPFKKIKGLIQKLIERLLTEAKNEATKKGFCDTELGKARKERDFRLADAKDLNADLSELEAKRDALTEEIKQLKKDIKDETKALKDTTDEREKEKKNNLETLKTAKEGLDGVNEAILVLKNFYKQAAKAAFLEASPVDEDTAGAGFSGNYKGKQGSMNAVFALLDTLASDFDRTLRTTEESEANAHREFVEFSQATEASIAGKKTKKDLDEEDLKTTLTTLKVKMEDLQTAFDLLDKALQTLEELKPQCIDTGMSYAERVKKREEEMKALGKALCILDTENVESTCK